MAKNRGPMTLKEWMYLEDMTQADMARCTGISKNAISRYVRGVRVPNPYHCGLLVGFTGGEVTMDKLGEAVAEWRVGYEDGRAAGLVKSITKYR